MACGPLATTAFTDAKTNDGPKQAVSLSAPPAIPVAPNSSCSTSVNATSLTARPDDSAILQDTGQANKEG